jgi:hypothetical protein
VGFAGTASQARSHERSLRGLSRGDVPLHRNVARRVGQGARLAPQLQQRHRSADPGSLQARSVTLPSDNTFPQSSRGRHERQLRHAARRAQRQDPGSGPRDQGSQRPHLQHGGQLPLRPLLAGGSGVRPQRGGAVPQPVERHLRREPAAQGGEPQDPAGSGVLHGGEG